MSTRNFDSQVITQRLQDKVNASFVAVAQATKSQIQTPPLSVPSQGFVNQVVSGSMTVYAKSEGVTVRDTSCVCPVVSPPAGVVDLNIGGSQ
jgi:hypothetical protein